MFYHYLVQRIHVITSTLQSKLEESFQRGLESKDRDMLTQCLQLYASINRCQAAEGLFQTLVVHPHMDKVSLRDKMQVRFPICT